jgi:hypothetical protein
VVFLNISNKQHTSDAYIRKRIFHLGKGVNRHPFNNVKNYKSPKKSSVFFSPFFRFELYFGDLS